MLNYPASRGMYCRHTFASRLTGASVDLRTIQELGGWKSIKMVERYSHISNKHKAEAIGKISLHYSQRPENNRDLQKLQVVSNQ